MDKIADIIDKQIAENRTALPIFDGTAQRLQEMIQTGSFDVGAVEELIVSDPVLATALLRLSNSSFYAGLEKMTQVREAVVRLGVKKVASLVTLVTQKQNYKVRAAGLQPLVGALWKHSVACGSGAQWLAERVNRNDLASEAFMAGMLHDVGKLLILRVVDDLGARHRSFDPSVQVVQEMMATRHTQHGETLMRKWNIPELYCDVVRHHHDDDFDDEDTLLLLVRLVDQACNRVGLGLEAPADINVSASAEAHALRLSEVQVAELEIKLEDSPELADDA